MPTGLAHGTVTVVAGGRPFEVTTFRRDVETFGRRAVVAFSTDLREDAARRDFTMNALYVRPDGTVVDPLGGLARPARRPGALRRRPGAARIAEDYLRILRFFRFHAWYGDPAGGLDPDGLAACAALQDGLARLSRERVGAEMTKLLAAPDPAPAVGRDGRRRHPRPRAARRRRRGARAARARSRRRPGASRAGSAALAALGWRPEWAEALRLSRADARALEATAAALAGGEPPAVAAYRHGPDAARDAALIRAATLGAPPPADLEAEIARGAAAVFPLARRRPRAAGPGARRGAQAARGGVDRLRLRARRRALLRAGGG